MNQREGIAAALYFYYMQYRTATLCSMSTCDITRSNTPTCKYYMRFLLAIDNHYQ